MVLQHRGTCEFIDHDKVIFTFLLSMFDGLKITDGVQTPFRTNPSKLKVHKKWVEWYATHGADWETARGPFDILESYALAAARLYGASVRSGIDALHAFVSERLVVCG